MKYQYHDDLFRDTTMTFGEHLEDLRRCLFKALAGLVIGVLLGLMIGKPVVQLIQVPLTSALEDYAAKRQVKELARENDARIAAGQKVEITVPELKKLQADEGLMFEEVYVDPQRVLEQLRARYPKAFDKVDTPNRATTAPLTKGDLIPLYLWRSREKSSIVRPLTLGSQEAFMIYMKAAVVAGIVLSSPWVFWQVWSFVAAGLYPHEKHYVYTFLPFSLGLFLAGVCLAFFFVFKPVLTFLFSFNDWLDLDFTPRLSEWLSFVLILPLGFGISFQLPLVMLFLERIGVFPVRAYTEKWRIAVMAIVVISAVLTPADPYSLLLMAIPLVFLYFGGVLLCHYMPRGPSLLDGPAAE